MTVGKVVGKLVCTPKYPTLTGVKLLLVRQYGADGKPDKLVVAADSICAAGPGNVVYLISSSEAAASFRCGPIPVDLAIVGIVDGYNSGRCQLQDEIQ